MEISGNKGEWSELYVLFKLLGEKKIYAGDGNLNKLNAFYPVLKILRDEVKRHMEYSFDKDEKTASWQKCNGSGQDDSTSIGTIPEMDKDHHHRQRIRVLRS